VLEGDVPSPVNPPPGCPFQNRCPDAMSICRNRKPALGLLPGESGTHQVSCHLYTGDRDGS
ncbi:MAG TPA: dipeptide/oligopeptide/nickel ABC transporter ATP-binding protein, partial [Chromatiales bacterium]|nr:dipeptide/oligopeptide/nickel ABC transporter ATP-binding protein [Chromatiales bacterium]